jgi:predicted MFS family arabinose efflux permease
MSSETVLSSQLLGDINESTSVVKRKRKPCCDRESPMYNIVLLALAWALTLTTSTLLMTIGPLSAQKLGASDSIAAFTVGIFLIGAALSSVPSAQIFANYGRFVGFSIGCVCQLIGKLRCAGLGVRFR